jgi:hypothetical protein
MELMTQAEVDQSIEAMERLAEEVKVNPQLAEQLLSRLEERPLTEQPPLSPKERYERWLQSSSSNGALRK